MLGRCSCASAIGPGHSKHNRCCRAGPAAAPPACVDAGAVAVELGVAEAIGPAVVLPDQLGTQHVAVERVGALPIRDVDDAMIELQFGMRCSRRLTLCVWLMNPAGRGAAGFSAWRLSSRRHVVLGARAGQAAQRRHERQAAFDAVLLGRRDARRIIETAERHARCDPCRRSGRTAACRSRGRSRARPLPSSGTRRACL